MIFTDNTALLEALAVLVTAIARLIWAWRRPD
jgi:hypothetical protein